MSPPYLRQYQLDAALWIWDSERGGLIAFPPGTGKTAIGSYAAGQGALQPVLVVAPNGPVLQHWQNEYFRWAERTTALAAGDKTKRAAARDLIADGVCETLVINYECMRLDIDALLDLGFKTIVFDESHRLKNHKSLAFKSAIKLARRAERVIMFSGTPILNHPSELWTTLALLQPDKYKSYWRWAEVNFHIDQERHRGRIVRKVGKMKRPAVLAEEYATNVLQGRLDEFLPQLPDVTETTLTVTLTPAERKAYDSMRKDCWADVQGNIITAANVAAKTVRLRQLASDWTAWGSSPEPQPHQCPPFTLDPGTKVKAAVDLINDSEEQWVVLCQFRGPCEAISRQLPGPQSVVYHGGLSHGQRIDAIGNFVAGNARVIAGTFATLAEGVDGLQCARNIILLDRDWTPARNEQAIGRLHRSGQKNAVNVIHLVAADTIDQRVAQALQEKTDVIQAIINGGKS